MNDDPIWSCDSKKAWTSWLAKHHKTSSGVWVKLAKKQSGIESMSQPDAVEVALCYGWIDGQARSVDTNYWVQRFTPRSPRSLWSKINCARAEALIASGKMRAAGLKEVDRAKKDGRWAAAYDSPRSATVPDDLAQALATNKKAREFFAVLDSRNRYAILHRIHNAKKAETRARRIANFVDMLSEKKTIYPRQRTKR
jgi:uncharacterized protein YdeI (YjbR/CyaY-like superfamily)